MSIAPWFILLRTFHISDLSRFNVSSINLQQFFRKFLNFCCFKALYSPHMFISAHICPSVVACSPALTTSARLSRHSRSYQAGLTPCHCWTLICLSTNVRSHAWLIWLLKFDAIIYIYIYICFWHARQFEYKFKCNDEERVICHEVGGVTTVNHWQLQIGVYLHSEKKMGR